MKEKKRESEKKKEKANIGIYLRLLGKTHSWRIIKEFKICGVKEEMLKSVWVFVVKRGSCLSLQSLWSQDTQAMGVLIFNHPKKRRRIKREEKKRRPWPRKYFLVHLLPGLWETSHEDPSKRSCSAVDRAVATDRSKSSCRNGRGLPRQGTQSSAVNHMWGFHAMGTGPLLCTPPPHNCPPVTGAFCGESASSFMLKFTRVKGHTFSLYKAKARCERNNEAEHPAAVSVCSPSPCLHS